MATTKKPTSKAVEAPVVARPVTDAERDNLLAEAYLSDLVYDALLERGEASKVSEIAQEINNPNITFALVRRALDSSPRFVLVDRLWNLGARYMDVTRPVDRCLTDVIRAAGKPLSTAQLATELSVIYNRPSETYFQLLRNIVTNTHNYFKAPGSSYGLTEWLPLVDGEDIDEVLADNKLKEATIAPLKAVSAKAGWGPTTYADASYRLITALKGRAIPHRLLGVLAWISLGESYDPTQHLVQCLTDPRLIWLSADKGKGRWVSRETVERLESLLAERAATLAEEPEEVIAPPVEVVEPEVVEVPTEEPAAEAVEVVEEPAPVVETIPPLQVKEEELEALSQVLIERGVPVEVAELLALQYEVVAGDPSYKNDVATLEAALKDDPRFLYVGAGRFREPDTLPPFVFSVPEFLSFPELQFVSMDGEIMDEEIEDEGLVGTLRQDLLLPLAQDVGDDEGSYTGAIPDDPTAVRLVVKAHHKEIGTFPLCQVPDGFFPTDAAVVEVIVREEDGTTHEIVVNNELRLAFNFFGLYEKLEADSGALFILQRGVRPYEYRFEVLEETDPQVYIHPDRYADLLALREQAEESGDMATFDITCELISDYPKGLDFVQLLTEVNVVRRVTRRKLASILSNYYCFVQKAGQSLWRFDVKKRDLGTDSAKRKYIKR